MDHSEFYKAVHAPEEEAFKDKPYGWIQWKGTDVCIDMHCACGSHGHIDGMFSYHYECLFCGRKYALSAHLKLIELTPEQAKLVQDGGGCGFKNDPDVLSDDPITGGAPESEDAR